MREMISAVPVDRKATCGLAAMIMRQRIEWGAERKTNGCASESVQAAQVDGKALAFSFRSSPVLTRGVEPFTV